MLQLFWNSDELFLHYCTYQKLDVSTGATFWNKSAWNARKKAFFADDDQKVEADDAELGYEQLPASSGLPPPVPGPLKSPTTRIPMKLAPLKRHRSESSSGFPRRSPSSLDRMTRGWKSGDSDMEPHSSSARSSLSSDRASRDYTNLRYQDPEFYERPKLMDNSEFFLVFF